jgi:hypothetical protein
MARLQIDVPEDLNVAIRARFRTLKELTARTGAAELDIVRAQMKVSFLQMQAGKPGAKEEWEQLQAKEQEIIKNTQPLSVGSIFIALLRLGFVHPDDEVAQEMTKTDIRQGRKLQF